MLLINGTLLDFNDTENPYVQRVNDSIKKLENLAKGDILISYTDIHKQVSPDDHRKVEYAKKVALPFRQTILGQNGVSETWQYYETTGEKAIDGGGFIQTHLPKRFELEENIRFQKGAYDKTLLYFLVFVSVSCDEIKQLRTIQNLRPNAIKHYKVELPEVQSEKDVLLAQKRIKVEYKILTEMSEEQLRTTAKAMDISGTDGMQVNQLRQVLSSVSIASEANMDKFFDCANDTPMADIKGLITDCIEKRIIVYNPLPKKVYKYFDYVLNKPMDVILEVKAGVNHRNAIDTYFQTHSSEVDVLREKLKIFENNKI